RPAVRMFVNPAPSSRRTTAEPTRPRWPATKMAASVGTVRLKATPPGSARGRRAAQSYRRPFADRVESRDGGHPFERDLGVFRGDRIDGDAVHDPAFDEVLEHPAEVRRVDAEHRRARAHERIERDDRLAGGLGVEALHEMDLGRDAEDRALGSS